MSISTNEVYIGFSFIGFVLCTIPLYWHLKVRNTGTCLYMFWTGLGCLLQCVNSIVWNKNMIDSAPVYCDIATRIQAAENVAIPASSLCINRCLYRFATAITAKATKAEKRRAVIQDLLIGVGIPILQMIAQYVVSSNRYDIFEGYGPHFTMANTPLVLILFSSWPIAIGAVSFYYCVRTIYTLYICQRQFRQIMPFSQGFSSGLYFRLMVLSSIEILGTIPLGTYILMTYVKEGLGSWESWASMHSDYSDVYQIPESIWMNNRQGHQNLEMYRWLLVVCAFIFFAFFGFAKEAREHYRLVYTSIASRIGYPGSTLHGPSHASRSSVSSMSTWSPDAIDFSGVKTSGENKPGFSLTDEPSLQFDLVAKPGIKIDLEKDSTLNYPSSSVESFDEPRMQSLAIRWDHVNGSPCVCSASCP